jgi:hypothetical protein
MPTRHSNGSHYESHQRAAELHEQAALAHRLAAQSREQQDRLTLQEQSKQALDRSHEAYLYTQRVHQKAMNGHGIALFGPEDTAALAYELWQARGCPEGSPDQDWLRALELLRSKK